MLQQLFIKIQLKFRIWFLRIRYFINSPYFLILKKDRKKNIILYKIHAHENINFPFNWIMIIIISIIFWFLFLIETILVTYIFFKNKYYLYLPGTIEIPNIIPEFQKYEKIEDIKIEDIKIKENSSNGYSNKKRYKKSIIKNIYIEPKTKIKKYKSK